MTGKFYCELRSSWILGGLDW